MAQSATFAAARQKLRDIRADAYLASAGMSTYERDEGLLVIPVMGAVGTAPVVRRVHAPIGYRQSEFSYAKDRVPPLFPAMANTTTGDLILTSELGFPTPRPNTNGDLTFGVTGRYTFVQPSEPRGTESEFPIDKHPYVSALDILHTLPPPTGEPDKDMFWTWNSDAVDARLLCSYDILG
jgi:hypothetical protein